MGIAEAPEESAVASSAGATGPDERCPRAPRWPVATPPRVLVVDDEPQILRAR